MAICEVSSILAIFRQDDNRESLAFGFNIYIRTSTVIFPMPTRRRSRGQSPLKLYYFAGRRTPVVARSARQARSNMRRPNGATAKLVATARPNAQESRLIAQGKWVPGNRNRSPNVRGYGAAPKGNTSPRRT